MAVNQGRIIEQLESLVSEPDRSEFIFGFMQAFGFATSTVTQVKQGGNRNVASVPGHVGIKLKLYFQPCENSSDLETDFDARISDPLIAKHKIRFVIATDYQRILAWDTLAKDRLDIDFDELPRNYGFFLPLVGLEKAIIGSENPADVAAAEKMGKLFDLIRVQNELSKPEDIHALNVFLTRLLFCMFAEDTGIFQDGQFTLALKNYTDEDGSGLDDFLDKLFSVLNTPEDAESRKALPTHFADFPYVNGGLFTSDEPIPDLGKKGRRTLLDCCAMNWAAINPDIFGSMFQAVIDVEQRSSLGQHYTSYSNIMKVIQPLFLEPLRSELDSSRKNSKALKSLLVRLGQIKVFDPACGSGNFLIVAYKELRQLEMEVIQALRELEGQAIFVTGIHLDQFHGIEIDDFACEIARLSLWLAEHQLNKLWQKEFGDAPPTLPLSSTGKIVHGNSLTLDWFVVCPKSIDDEVYIIGNPPFRGHAGRTDSQREDMQLVFKEFKSFGKLDYVSSWFWKGAQYIQNSKAELALVATNSICQGEQVAAIWSPILNMGLKIHIAYPTFSWSNNARDKAAVHVVIVGLSSGPRFISLFQLVDNSWHCKQVSNINPYLLEANDTVIRAENSPITPNIPSLLFGNMPYDAGNLLLSRTERDLLIQECPGAEKWIKKVLGAEEFLNSRERWCLWLVGATQAEIEAMPEVLERTKRVAAVRLASPDKAAHKLAERPHLFRDLNNPSSFILVPSVSSERRHYVPLGFFNADVISTNLNLIIPDGTLYEFGILSSMLHNDWMRLVAGRLESRYRYSASVVYNPFPWPEITAAQRKQIEDLAEAILFTREEFPGATLAQLYDPDKMPPALLEAHQALDRAVDKLYRDKPFKDASERLSCLLAKYELLVQNTEKQTKVKS
jgi:SAM-dependent methyltransferase